MIIFLLLIIIAILLFGSSAVLGAVGAVLGALVLVLALVFGVSVAAQVPIWFWWLIGAIVGGGVLVLAIANDRQQLKLRKMIDELDPAARAAYDKSQREAEVWTKRYEQGRKKGPYRR